MTLKYISQTGFPNYLAESADILDNASITGASKIGGTVLLTDTQEYKLILPNLKLIPFSYSNGESGIEPEYDSSEVGDVDASTLVLTFTEDIVANNYSLGFTIKVNDVVVEIDSADRQVDNSVIYFALVNPVVFGDDVTIEYDESVGGIVSKVGTVYLQSFNEVVTNNVPEEV